MDVRLTEGTQLRAGRYELRERIGRGGAATVWLADDTVLDRPVAVKVLSEGLAADPTWLTRFKREARLAAKLQHRNLVAVYDFDAGAERPYLVMEHMPGGSLFERLSGPEHLDPEPLARDLLGALDAIHSAGIVHRDVKPGNVLLDGDDCACLTDFGVAKPEDATSLTRTGQIPGTGRYMAPELWKGHAADARTDLFAAGKVLQQCYLADSSPDLRVLIGALTESDRSMRPDSAGEALSRLSQAAPAPKAPSAPAFEMHHPRVRVDGPRGRRVTALAALVCAGGLVAGAIALSGGDDAQPGDSVTPSAASPAGGERETSRDRGESRAEPETAAPPAEPAPDPEAAPEPAPAPAPSAADPAALNDEGFALIQAGRPDEAVPVLEQAVAGYPDGSRDIGYAYALYNLGNALYLSGRPDEAIPLLRERLQFADQRETVRATLADARRAAD